MRTALYSTFGERQVSTIYTPADTYQVILELAAAGAAGRGGLRATSSCAAAPARWCRCRASRRCGARSGPTSVNHDGQLQAITVSFNLAPGVPLGDATAQASTRFATS